MRVTFLGQPFEDSGGWTAALLSRWMQAPNTTKIRLAIAWMKRSGLARLQPEIERFRSRGGKIEAILGIDEGGATEQGLHLANEIFDSAFVFHDPASRTFHPKVYVSEMGDTAEVFVGSSNLTAGGLFSNYEAGLLVTLDLSQPDDRSLLDQVDAWFQMLYGDLEVCKVLDDQLLELIISDPRFKVGNEDDTTSRGPAQLDDYDGVVDASGQVKPFGVSTTPKKNRAPAIRRRARSVQNQLTSRVTPPPTSTPAAVPSIAQVTHRWVKRLSPSDAQHPPSQTTQLTANLKLTEAGNNIDRTTYFRHDMFGNLNWTTDQTPRGPKDSVTVPIHVTINGNAHGVQQLVIDHALFRVADQNNVPTWLHWGPLMPAMRSQNYSGWYVIIERMFDGRYRLRIVDAAP